LETTGQRGSSTPHRGAKPHRSWTPTRAEVAVSIGVSDVPNWTDPQAACWTRCRCMGQNPTQVADTFSVSLNTVKEHVAAADRKLQAWPGPESERTSSTRAEQEPDDEWTALGRRLLELEAEHAEIAELMSAGHLNETPAKHTNFDQWELALLHRRALRMPGRGGLRLRREDYEATNFGPQDWPIPQSAPKGRGPVQAGGGGRCPATRPVHPSGSAIRRRSSGGGRPGKGPGPHD
jgi:hypothetical protein